MNIYEEFMMIVGFLAVVALLKIEHEVTKLRKEHRPASKSIQTKQITERAIEGIGSGRNIPKHTRG